MREVGESEDIRLSKTDESAATKLVEQTYMGSNLDITKQSKGDDNLPQLTLAANDLANWTKHPMNSGLLDWMRKPLQVAPTEKRIGK